VKIEWTKRKMTGLSSLVNAMRVLAIEQDHVYAYLTESESGSSSDESDSSESEMIMIPTRKRRRRARDEGRPASKRVKHHGSTFRAS